MRILKKLVNDNIVLDVFIICQKSRTSDLKNTVLVLYVLIDLQSNPPKHPQSVANDVEGTSILYDA